MRGALAGSIFVSFTGQALLVVSGVLVARLLGPEDRGRLALIVLVPAVLGQLVSLGLPLAVTYFTASGADPRRMLRQLRQPIAAQLIVVGAIGTAIFGILAMFSTLHAGFAAIAAVTAAPGMLILQYGLASLQGLRRFRSFNIFRQAPAALYAVAVVCLYAAHVRSLVAITLVWSASYVVVGIAAFALATNTVGGAGETPHLGELLRFGLRGFVGATSPIETFRLDQVTIGVFLSPTSLGLYVVGLAFTNLPQFIGQSIGMVAYPHIAGKRDRAAARQAVMEFVVATSAICVLVCGALIVFAHRLIVLFFGEAFAPAADVTRILLCAAAIVSVRRLLGDAARGIGLPGAASLAEVASWVALPPALAIGVPLWGFEGVGGALVVAYGVSLVLLTWLVVRDSRRAKRPDEAPITDLSVFVSET